MNRWASVAQRIESATRTSEKVQHLAAALQHADEVDLEIAARLMGSRGMVESGTLAWGTIAKAVEEVAGAPAGSLAKLLDDGGDLGRAVEDLFESERPLAGPALEEIERSEQVRSEVLAEATGTLPAAHASAAPKLRALPAAFEAITSSSGQRRHDLLVQLFYGCSPIAAKFLVRALVGDLRIGLRDGLLEAAIADAFNADPAEVRWAMLLEGDPGRVALLARSGRLHEARLQLFHPIPPMLAAATSGVPEVVERLSERPEFAGRPEFAVAVEDKYDGVRAQLHIDGERAAVFGRDLHDVTVSFPEIAAAARAAGISGILDGEIVAWEDGRPLPSSTLISRLTSGAQTLSTQQHTLALFIAFDCLARSGEPLIQQPYHERRRALEELRLEQISDGQIRIATRVQVEGAEAIESAFIHARQRGCEGLVVKAPDAPYAPGRRGSGWLKVKRSLDTVDVIIVGAEPGLGRRRALLSECTFAVRDDLSGRLATIGRATVSLPDAEVAALSQWLEAHTIAQLGSYRSVEPRLVAEVAFDAVRRSERTASGFALRSPRITRLRSDLGPDQAATLASLESRCHLGSAQPDA
jgi:DNA ligase-1